LLVAASYEFQSFSSNKYNYYGALLLRTMSHLAFTPAISEGMLGIFLETKLNSIKSWKCTVSIMWVSIHCTWSVMSSLF